MAKHIFIQVKMLSHLSMSKHELISPTKVLSLVRSTLFQLYMFISQD